MAKEKAAKRQAPKKSAARKQPKIKAEAVVAPSLLDELTRVLPPELAHPVLKVYADLSSQTAFAASAGARSYPSQLRSGAGRVLKALGIDPASMKDFDRAVRIEAGHKK